MESILLCRDDEDYDHLEKSFYLAALDGNALVISEIAMSTHGHCAVLAVNWEEAAAVGGHVKKRHSQYLSRKYGERNIMARTRISVQYLDTDCYVFPGIRPIRAAGWRTIRGRLIGLCFPAGKSLRVCRPCAA